MILVLLVALLGCSPDAPVDPPQAPVDADSDGWAAADDCDDADADVHPDAIEACNAVDDDCDALVDDADPDRDAAGGVTSFGDADGDGYGDPGAGVTTCVAPAGNVADATDCDDGAPSVHPGAAEICGDVDDDCDGLVDDADPDRDAATGVGWFADGDGDGYGDPAAPSRTCVVPAGGVADATDCDDANAAIHPAATEACNGADDDCDALVDDADPDRDPATGIESYADADLDGYGDAATAARACVPPVGSVLVAGDCDDAAPDAYPGAPEVCGGADDDCDGLADDADPGLDLQTATAFHADLDADGYGQAPVATIRCVAPPRTVTDATDCDDANADRHPGAAEVCGGGDEDCDALVDDVDPGLDPASRTPWYADADGDLAGDPASPLAACARPPGHVAGGTDCDDGRASVHPGAPEVCGGLDDDCDALVDDADPDVDLGTGSAFYADADGDGWGDALDAIAACAAPDGYAPEDGDCALADPDVSPGAADVCEDGADQDCSGADRVCGVLAGIVDVDAVATTRIVGTHAITGFGSFHATLDWDGDGALDVAVSEPNSNVSGQGTSIWLYLGPLAPGSSLMDADAVLSVEDTAGRAGFGVALNALPDLDGDGDEELYVGAYANGNYGLLLGNSASGAMLDVDAILPPATPCGLPIGIHDPDGVPRWACGDASWSEVHIIEGIDTTVGTIVGKLGDSFGGSMAGGDDLDGDGLPDLWVATQLEDGRRGAAYLFTGPLGDSVVADAEGSVHGVTGYQQLGYRLDVADIDGDGHTDYLASSMWDDTAATNAGAWYAWLGPLDPTATTSDADVYVPGRAKDELLGMQRLAKADLDGNGAMDLLFSAQAGDGAGESRGTSYLLYGPFGGTVDLADAFTDGAYLEGGYDYAHLGADPAFTGDLTGDGGMDLVIGGIGEGPGGTLFVIPVE